MIWLQPRVGAVITLKRWKPAHQIPVQGWDRYIKPIQQTETHFETQFLLPLVALFIQAKKNRIMLLMDMIIGEGLLLIVRDETIMDIT